MTSFILEDIILFFVVIAVLGVLINWVYQITKKSKEPKYEWQFDTKEKTDELLKNHQNEIKVLKETIVGYQEQVKMMQKYITTLESTIHEK